MTVGVAIASLARVELLENCLTHLGAQTIASTFNVRILDGNESPELLAGLASRCWPFRDLCIIREHEVLPPSQWGRWPVMYNTLFRLGDDPYVTYWSDDVIPDHSRCFEIGVRILDKEPSAGAVAFRWRDGGHPYRVYTTEFKGQPLVNFGLLRSASLKSIGYLDEGYSFYYADQDATLALAAAGMSIHSCEHGDHECSVTHWSKSRPHNPNRSPECTRRDIARFQEKWS